MAQQPLRPEVRLDGEEVDIRQKSLFARLKKLFSSGVVVRNVGGKKLKVKDTSDLMYATDRNSLRDRFNRVRSTSYNAYTRDFSLAYQAARIDLFRDYDCVGPDTIIPLPDGSKPTIKELTEKYKDKQQERFYVYSYDHETDSIKLGKAYHPRKKGGGTRMGYKVTFDNGQYVIGSIKHPFLMRDGTYKRILELEIGDSIMPFYQHEYGYKKGGIKSYRRLYNFSRGYQSIHKIVTEQFYGPLKGDEVIHHKDFNGFNNAPENLQIMDRKKHDEFHSNHSKNVIWGKENYETQLNKLKSHPNYINRNFHHWNGERSGENNPFYGKIHTILANEFRSKTLKEVFKNRNQNRENNPKYRDDLTIEILRIKASDFYKINGKLTLWKFIKNVGCDYSTFQNRLKWNNVSWEQFKEDVVSTLNHTVVSIECIGPLEVYDITVEKYHNFATDSVFVKNTMDMDPILSSALDIYADESLTVNELGKILVVHAEDDNVKGILNNLFYDVLNIEHNLWSWTRNLSKYGDFYMRLYISPQYGVYQIEPISAYNVERLENTDPLNKNYVKFQIRPTDTSQVETLEFFECAHFRLLSDSNFLPYGKSMIENARRVWKQLSLMEDAMLINRIMRAPERRIFKLDVGNIPPQEVDNFMEKAISKMKKVPYIDPQTGDYNLRFNLQNMVEDYYLPVRGPDSGTSIETLSGIEWTGIDDIEYLRNKLMAALKIPKAFLGYEEELSGKATLASEDVRFARTIQRIQRVIISELEKIAIVHLYAQGYRDESLVNFKLDLTNPSTVFEKEKIEVWGNKTELAKNMMENKLFSKKWIYKNIFNLSKDDSEQLLSEIVEDSKQIWRFKSIEEEGNDPAKPFQKINPNAASAPPGPVGGGLPSLGGPGGLGGPDLGSTIGGAPTEALPTLQEAKQKGDVNYEKWKQMNRPPYKGTRGLDEVHGEHAEDYERPSQEGEHDARKQHPFGEDPLGNLENNRKPHKGSDSLTPKWAKNSPLSLETLDRSSLIKSLSRYLSKHKEEKKELIKESKTEVTRSVLDERNIIDE